MVDDMVAKEKVLSNLIELVKTLYVKANIDNDRIKYLWREKSDLLSVDINNLSVSDKRWLEDEYAKWHRENIQFHKIKD